MSRRKDRGLPKFNPNAAGPAGGAGGLMSQMAKMQEDMAAAQKALEDETLDVTAGGGAITITITGHQRIKAIQIDPAIIDVEDEEWATDLQDLLVAAVNSAIEQSQAMSAERLEGITGNLGGMLPGGLGDMLGL